MLAVLRLPHPDVMALRVDNGVTPAPDYCRPSSTSPRRSETRATLVRMRRWQYVARMRLWPGQQTAPRGTPPTDTQSVSTALGEPGRRKSAVVKRPTHTPTGRTPPGVILTPNW